MRRQQLSIDTREGQLHAAPHLITTSQGNQVVSPQRFSAGNARMAQPEYVEVSSPQPHKESNPKPTKNAHHPQEPKPGTVPYVRPRWLIRLISGDTQQDAQAQSLGDTSIENYGNLKSQFRKEKKVEITVVQGSHMPSFDFKSACSPFVSLEYENQSDRTKPVKKSFNPTWNHLMLFRFFPKRLIVHGKVYDWQATKRHHEIGTFKFAIREDVELDVEYEHLATLRHPDGASVMGEGGKASTITLQIRVTEKTFNMNLPPYKFENTVFVKQQEVEDDGVSPRQFAHFAGWLIPSLSDTLTTAEHKGTLIERKNKFADGFNRTLKQRQKHQIKHSMRGVKLTIREKVAAMCSNLWFQLGIMLVVLVDILSIVVFLLLPSDNKDCFDRDSQAEVVLSFTVIAILTSEIVLRIFGHGAKFFKAASNLFDLMVVILSLTIAFIKLVGDFLMDVSICAQFEVLDQCEYPKVLKASAPECKAIKESDEFDLSKSNSALGFVGASPRFLRQVAVIVRLTRVVAGLIRAKRMRANLQEKIRQAVAAKKRRYQRDGFDLDVTYITNRCLAMSTPGFGAHKGYRNDMAEVSRFFNMYHYGKYRIYNLCEEFEGNYHPAMLFFQMRRYAFDDHNAPTLKQIMAFCQNALEYMTKDPEHVISVHCKGGKGRTGVMVCCWLLFSGHRAIALDALELFAFRRSVQYHMNNHDNQTAEAPSQMRYVHYLEAILYNDINPAAEPNMLLRAIELRNCPAGPIFVSVMIFAKGGVLYDSRQACEELPSLNEGDNYVFEIPVTLVYADVKVEIFRHENKSPLSGRIGTQKYDSKVEKWPWCQGAFHTLLHYKESLIEYKKMQIDYCHKDRKHEKFPSDFAMALHFVRPEDMGGYALTLNHLGCQKRSKFASFDPSVMFGGLKLFIHSADGLIPSPSDSTKVKVEIEGSEMITVGQPKNEDYCEWNQTLSFVTSSKNVFAKITVLDRRGLIDVPIAQGRLAVSRDELQKAARKEMLSSLTSKTEEASANLARTILLDVVSGNGEEVNVPFLASKSASKTGAKAAEGSGGKLKMSFQYQSWDLPKEYWDRHSFCDLIRKVGRRETAFPGQEIVSAGENKHLLYLVLSGVVNVQINRISSSAGDGENILVDMLGENAIFGAFSFLSGFPEMQHIAYTNVELAVIDLGIIMQEGEEPDQNADPKAKEAEGAQDDSKVMRIRDKVLFFKVLALGLSEKFQMAKQENIRITGRFMQSDENESLQNEVMKQELRLLCVQKFGLPATDQCLFVGNAVKVWITMSGETEEKHFRCRLIFLSSCIVLEPTLKGTIFLKATYEKHHIDATRIVSVRTVSDDGPGEIIVSYTDLNAHYDNCFMSLGRHALLELRLLFHDHITREHCTRILHKMAETSAEAREKERMVKTVLGGESVMPSLEKLLSKAVFAGLLQKYEANCSIEDCPIGSLVYVARGSMRVMNVADPPDVLYTLRPGEMYGDHQFLSGSMTVTSQSLMAGNMGVELVVLHKEYLMNELIGDLPFAVGAQTL